MAYATLREAANARGIKFGGAVQRYEELTGDAAYAAIVTGETNAIKVGGDYFTIYGSAGCDSMKPNGFHLSEGTFSGSGEDTAYAANFTWDPDTFATYARTNGLALHGHTLLWYTALPYFFASICTTPERTRAVAKAHIEGVIGHYAASFSDVVYAWDVVNEPTSDGASPVVGDRGGLWTGMYTGDPNHARWVEDSFTWARAAAPSVKLFVNDYGIEFAGAKQDALYAWLVDALSRGIPIDGVGLQCHFGMENAARADEFAATLERFSALGLELQVSEGDFGWDTNPSGADYPPRTARTEPELAAQAEAYGSFVRAAVECSAVTGVYLWNLATKYSYGEYTDPDFGWYMEKGFFGLWDSSLVKKPAYTSVLDAVNGRLTAGVVTQSGSTATLGGDRALDSTVTVT